MDGWMEVKAGLRIAQIGFVHKKNYGTGRKEEWVEVKAGLKIDNSNQ